ncbi:DUF6785 family protein [Candidatus Poribacteria bacterium]
MTKRHESEISYRAIVIGILLMPINAYWIAMAEMVWHGLHFSATSLPMNVIFTLFVLVGINALVEKIKPGWRLTQAELLVIYVMLAVTTSFIGHDNMVSLMGVVPHATWFATPENEWNELFSMYLPDWLVVSNNKAAEHFYKGDVNFFASKNIVRYWLGPILSWTAIIYLIFAILMFLNVLLRRRWIEYEKLPYPIAQLPMDMAAPGLKLFRNKTLWIGFTIAAVVEIINGLNYIYPAIPRIPIREKTYDLGLTLTEKPWNTLGTTYIHLRLFLIGLCFLLPLELSFSTWFFYLVRKGQNVVGSMMGWYSLPGYPFQPYQAIGAVIAIFVMSIFTGRHYLRDVLKLILGMRADMDDSGEPVRYRTAVVGIFVCAILLFLICREAGMSSWVFILFFLLYGIFAVSVTRIRAQLGPPVHDIGGVNPHTALITTMGTRPFGRSNLIIFSLFSWFNGTNRCHPMPHQLEAFKIAERKGINNKKLLWVMMICFPIGVMLAMWIYPYTLYKYGASVAVDAPGQVLGSGNGAYNALASWLLYPKPTDTYASSSILVGFFFSMFLYFMRLRFIWWPFHPVGYVIGINGASVDHYWFAMILASTVKFIALRHGGARTYRKLMPFFLGLVLGDIVIGCYWSILSVIIEMPLYVVWFW